MTPLRRAPQLSALRAPDGISALLASPPTPAEAVRVRSGMNILFDSPPTPAEERVVTDLLRAAHRLQFYKPMPVTGATSLRTWLASAAPTWSFRSGLPYSYGDLGSRLVNIKRELLSVPQNRSWSDGMMHLLGLIVHESTHAMTGGIGHNCAGNHDSTIGLGGAWAAQCWYYVWLANETGNALTADERLAAAREAAWIRQNRFCDAQLGGRLRSIRGTRLGDLGHFI